MSLVTWEDVGLAEGAREVKGYTVTLRHAHIEQWKEDPDGRFKLAPVDGQASAAELGQFFPSL